MDLSGWGREQSVATAAWFATYGVIYVVSKRLCIRHIPSYRKLTPTDAADWDSRITSNVNAILCVIVAALMWLELRHVDRDFISATTPYTGYIGPAFIGYLAWDAVFITWTGISQLSTYLHHSMAGMSAFCFTASGYATCGFCVFLATELTTPFVNQRTFFALSDQKTSPLYVLNGLLMFVGFVVCRVGAIPVIFSWYAKWFTTMMEQQPLFTIYTFIAFASVSVLNCYWTVLIGKGLVKALTSGSSNKGGKSQ